MSCKRQQPPYKPLDYDEKTLLQFLQANKDYSSTHQNTLRFSIVSVFSVIHSNRPPIAEQSLIKDFSTEKRNSEVKIPTEQQSATWDISRLLQATFVSNKQANSGPTTIEDYLLICIATMW